MGGERSAVAIGPQAWDWSARLQPGLATCDWSARLQPGLATVFGRQSVISFRFSVIDAALVMACD